MRKIALIMSLGIVLAGCTPVRRPVYVPPPPPKPVVKDEVDRFTGIRKVSWTSVVSGPGLFASYLATADKAGSFKKSTPVIILTTTGREWKYLKCNGTHWLADGARVPTIEVKHDGSVMTGGVIEHIANRFTYADFQRLAAAKSVEYKVCNDEFILYPSEIEGLKRTAELMDTPGYVTPISK